MVAIADIHDDEGAVAATMEQQTVLVIQQLRVTGTVALQSLSDNLGTLNQIISELLNEEADQQHILTENSNALAETIARLPESDSEETINTIAAINSVVGEVESTPDIVRLQNDMYLVNTHPDPTVLGGFTSGMIEHSLAMGQARSEALRNAMANVNGLKALIDEELQNA